MNSPQRAVGSRQRAVASAAAIAAFALTWAVLTAHNGPAPPLPLSPGSGDSVIRSNASTASRIACAAPLRSPCSSRKYDTREYAARFGFRSIIV